MIDTSKSYYLELEQKLYSLRCHYALCQGASNEETLDWAKFFFSWSQKASKYCDSWGVENLRSVENFLRSLEKSKIGIMAYEVLERIMNEAYWNLNQEILKSLRDREAKSFALKSLEKKNVISVVDIQGFTEDIDSPQNTRLH